MENKYYTPQIEEFHIGFEFEIKGASDNKWIIDTFSLEHTWYHTHNKFPIHFREHIKMNQIRVKCLDKEDIEELWGEKKEKFYTIEKKNHKYHIIVIEQNHCIITMHTQNGRSEMVLFSGVCKNKSELKIIMKQTGIIQ